MYHNRKDRLQYILTWCLAINTCTTSKRPQETKREVSSWNILYSVLEKENFTFVFAIDIDILIGIRFVTDDS